MHVLTQRSEISGYSKNFVSWIEKNRRHKVKRVHSDNGGEFMAMKRSLKKGGIDFFHVVALQPTVEQTGEMDQPHTAG